jgi:hypothetical protein
MWIEGNHWLEAWRELTAEGSEVEGSEEETTTMTTTTQQAANVEGSNDSKAGGGKSGKTMESFSSSWKQWTYVVMSSQS